MRKNEALLVGLLLALATVAVYWPVHDHEFISLDDRDYILDNAHVRDGFSRAGVLWALTSTRSANWHPLTWYSHMLDCRLFGLSPGAHHLSSVALHALAAVLLFLALRAMTAATGPSAVVAAVFALHPLHVESVAWAAERKDVLSGVFWMLCLLAYAGYARQVGVARYLLVLLALALGLMAKPMLVTLPLVLLLLDVWPLQRFDFTRGKVEALRCVGQLVAEKLPLLGLCALSSWVTLVAQQGGGAVRSLENLPLTLRGANALVATVAYLSKSFWPAHLAILYPHPAFLPYPLQSSLILPAAGAAMILGAVTVAVAALRRHPCLIVGWLWFLVTLVPVIGLVHVGEQGMADRYTYIPQIGLALAVVWGLRALSEPWRPARAARIPLALIVLACFALVARHQVAQWKDSATVYRHALSVTRDNYLAHSNLGLVLLERGELDAAEEQLLAALRVKPDIASVHTNLGVVALRRGDTSGAETRFRSALQIEADDEVALNNLGVLRARTGDLEGAVALWERALAIRPDNVDVRANVGRAHAAAGRWKLAVESAIVARDLARRSGDAELAAEIDEQLHGYRARLEAGAP